MPGQHFLEMLQKLFTLYFVQQLFYFKSQKEKENFYKKTTKKNIMFFKKTLNLNLLSL